MHASRGIFGGGGGSYLTKMSIGMYTACHRHSYNAIPVAIGLLERKERNRFYRKGSHPNMDTPGSRQTRYLPDILHGGGRTQTESEALTRHSDTWRWPYVDGVGKNCRGRTEVATDFGSNENKNHTAGA